jgi:hypothetical protein
MKRLRFVAETGARPATLSPVADGSYGPLGMPHRRS